MIRILTLYLTFFAVYLNAATIETLIELADNAPNERSQIPQHNLKKIIALKSVLGNRDELKKFLKLYRYEQYNAAQLYDAYKNYFGYASIDEQVAVNEGQTVVCLAAWNKNYPLLNALIDAHEDNNNSYNIDFLARCGTYDSTLLHVLAKDASVSEMIIQRITALSPESVNTTTAKHRKTPAMTWLSKRRNKENKLVILRALLDGIDENIQTIHRANVLHFALSSKSIYAIKELLGRWAHLASMPDRFDKSPFMRACESSSKKIIKIFEDALHEKCPVPQVEIQIEEAVGEEAMTIDHGSSPAISPIQIDPIESWVNDLINNLPNNDQNQKYFILRSMAYDQSLYITFLRGEMPMADAIYDEYLPILIGSDIDRNLFQNYGEPVFRLAAQNNNWNLVFAYLRISNGEINKFDWQNHTILSEYLLRNEIDFYILINLVSFGANAYLNHDPSNNFKESSLQHIIMSNRFDNNFICNLSSFLVNNINSSDFFAHLSEINLVNNQSILDFIINNNNTVLISHVLELASFDNQVQLQVLSEIYQKIFWVRHEVRAAIQNIIEPYLRNINNS